MSEELLQKVFRYMVYGKFTKVTVRTHDDRFYLCELMIKPGPPDNNGYDLQCNEIPAPITLSF